MTQATSADSVSARQPVTAGQPGVRWTLPPLLIVLPLLTGIWLLFFWRILTPVAGDRVTFVEGDFTHHYYAFAAYQVDQLWAGQFPLWNPYNHSGAPFAANIQNAAFYPPRLLLAGLVGRDGFSIEEYQLEAALHYWLASVLVYAFLHARLRGVFPALTGSLLFTYGGFLTGYPMLQVSILASVVWLPLMLLGVHHSLSGGRWAAIGGVILAGLALAFSVLSGHPQMTLYIGWLMVAYLLYRGYQRRLPLVTILARLIAIGGIGGGLSAIQLLPALEFTRLSYRVLDFNFLDKANGFAPLDLLQTVLPGWFGPWSPLYVGIAGLLLAGIGAMVHHPRSERSFWLAAGFIGLLLSLGKHSIIYDGLYLLVPGFSLFRQQERAVVLVGFAAAVLAADGLAALLDQRHNTGYQAQSRALAGSIYGFAGLALLAGIGVTVAGNTFNSAISSIVMFTALNALLFAGWFFWLQRAPRLSGGQVGGVLLALLVLNLFSIGINSTNFVPDVPESRVQLPEPLAALPVPVTDITWRVDGAVGLQDYAVYFRIPDLYGTGPLSLAAIEELRQLPVDRFWEVLAARYVTAVDDPPPGVPLTLLAEATNPAGQPYRLFELTDPRPLAHLVYDYREASGSPAFARQIMADARVNLREMAVTLAPLPFALPVTRPAVSQVSDFQMETPERITMTVTTGADALLTVAIPGYPGWQAQVNGQPVNIVDVYAGLIGIPIRAGAGQPVVLEFAPPTVYTGALISGVTLLLVMVISVISAAAGLGFRQRGRTVSP